MKRVLHFLLLFVPVLLLTLYLSGDLRRLARLPQKKPIERPDEELPLVETERGYLLRSVGNWSVQRYARDSLRLLWSAKGSSAFVLDEETFAVQDIETTFVEYDDSGNLRWKSRITADEARVWMGDGASYLAELTGEVLAWAETTLHQAETVHLKTESLKIKVTSGKKKRSAELRTDSPVTMRIGETEVSGKGLRAHSALRRVVVNEDVSVRCRSEEGDVVRAKGNCLGLRQREDGTYELRMAPNVSIDYEPTGGKTPSMRVSGSLLRLQLSSRGGLLGGEVTGNVVLFREGKPLIYAKEAVYVVAMRRITLHGSPTVMFTDGRNELFAKEAVCEMPKGDEKRLILHFIDDVVAKLATRHREKERRWLLTTTHATLILTREGETAEWYVKTVDCPDTVVMENIGGRTRIETSSLKVSLSEQGIFEGCVGKDFRIEMEGMSAGGENLRVVEGGRTLTLEGSVSAELMREEGRLLTDCEELKVRLKEDGTLRSADASGVERCIIEHRDIKGVSVETKRLFYDAETAALTFGKDKVRLKSAEDVFDISSLKLDVDKRVVVGGATEGIMHAREMELKVSADSVRLTLGVDGLRSVELKGDVRVVTDDLSISSANLTYDSVTQEASMKDVRLKSHKGMSLVASACKVYLPLRRAVFTGKPKAEGTQDSKRWGVTADRMVLVYKGVEGRADSLSALYAEGAVEASLKDKEEKTELACSRCVYLRRDGKITVTGSPAVLKREGVVVREASILYDIEKGVIETGPNIKGYDWEVDPLKFRKK